MNARCCDLSLVGWEDVCSAHFVPEGRTLTKWRPPHIPYLRRAIRATSGCKELIHLVLQHFTVEERGLLSILMMQSYKSEAAFYVFASGSEIVSRNVGTCHHGMARPQVADGGDSLNIWRVAANILNKQLRTADKWWSSSVGVGRGATNSSS
jgi:hypothetical protein